MSLDNHGVFHLGQNIKNLLEKKFWVQKQNNMS